jgi:hypothetical protein
VLFDDKGRLYVTESPLEGESGGQLKKSRPVAASKTRMATVFSTAHGVRGPVDVSRGVLWHQGVVYVSAVPQIWHHRP